MRGYWTLPPLLLAFIIWFCSLPILLILLLPLAGGGVTKVVAGLLLVALLVACLVICREPRQGCGGG